MTAEGILCIKKSAGLTSSDVVRFVKSLFRQTKVGHAGTLDPLAEGVLLILLGKATRVSEYLLNSGKVYCAVIVLGKTTTTCDLEGDIITEVQDIDVSLEKIREVLISMQGKILQKPPIYSAIKINGRRAYSLAQKGMDIDISPRQVTIKRIEIIEWKSPVLKLLLEVSKGTYIRSFARDLGENLGTGAYLHYLLRMSVGRFSLQEALSLQDLKNAAEFGYLEELIYPFDEAFIENKAVLMNDDFSKFISQGRRWKSIRDQKNEPYYKDMIFRAYNSEGIMTALLKYDVNSSSWSPHKVFA